MIKRNIKMILVLSVLIIFMISCTPTMLLVGVWVNEDESYKTTLELNDDDTFVMTGENIDSGSSISIPGTWEADSVVLKLMVDIDMSGYSYNKAIIAPHIGNQDLFKGTPFTGVFDGNGHIISHLTIDGGSLFGYLDSEAVVRDLGIVDVNIAGSHFGSLVSENHGHVTGCYSTGTVSGGYWVVGGLVGSNYGTVSHCYSNCEVSGNNFVGGLVGSNYGTLIHCYSNGAVSGSWQVGGLVGYNGGDMTKCFWDVETSGQTTSDGGTGKTTAEMQTADTFLEAGWDFVGETVNGPNDIWWILEGRDYPRLWWETSDL